MINNNNLREIIEEMVENADDLKEVIFDIVVKIDNLAYNKETKIADLINYDPRKNFVEPLTQGMIYNWVFKICNRLGISLENSESSLGGLAFKYNFKKLKSNNKKQTYTTENFKLEVYEQDAIVAPSHPAYFRGRFVLSIENNKGVAEIERNGYTLNETVIAELKNLVLKNAKKLKELLKKKKILENLYAGELEGGGPDSSIVLTYDNEKIEISRIEISGDLKKRAYDKILAKIQKYVKKAIKKGNAFVDENSPNPVMEAEEWGKDREERGQFFKALEERRRKLTDLLERLKTEKLYTYKKSDSLISGHYEYNPIIWEVFKEVGINNPKFRTYENHLAKTSEGELTIEEIVEQFLFWSRGERFSEGTIAEAIDSGNFEKLFIRYIAYTEPR